MAKRTTKSSRAVEKMMNRKVDLSVLKPAGTYLDMYEKACMELATAIHEAESDGVAVSWSAQQRAQDFFNEHGLTATLDEMFRLQKLQRPSHRL